MKHKDGQSTRGIVQAAIGQQKFGLSRFEPCSALRPFVEHYWSVRYHLADGETFSQTVLSYPNVHLAFEEDIQGRRCLVYGVPKRLFVRELRGAGRVLGIKFRAGGFYPFWGQPIARLTGETVAADGFFGFSEAETAELTDSVLDAGEEAAMAERAESALLARLPERDAQAELAARLTEEAMLNRSLTKAEQLGEISGLSARQLQRLFYKYVGVSPKWAIKRFRLQEAAERLERDEAARWTDLAAELEYFDQAHFIRDFKAVLGQTPLSYQKRARPEC